MSVSICVCVRTGQLRNRMDSQTEYFKYKQSKFKSEFAKNALVFDIQGGRLVYGYVFCIICTFSSMNIHHIFYWNSPKIVEYSLTSDTYI